MNLESMMGQLSEATEKSVETIKNGISQVDINDPQTMLKVQFSLQQYASFVNYQSTVIKTVRDLVSGIIAKI